MSNQCAYPMPPAKSTSGQSKDEVLQNVDVGLQTLILNLNPYVSKPHSHTLAQDSGLLRILKRKEQDHEKSKYQEDFCCFLSHISFPLEPHTRLLRFLHIRSNSFLSSCSRSKKAITARYEVIFSNLNTIYCGF